MLFLCDLPNPVHGMSSINLSILEAFKARGGNAYIINTVPSYASGLYGTWVWGAAKFFHTFLCWIKLLAVLYFSAVSVVYRPINGGAGQIYDLVYLIICRLARKSIYIHHHSFNYLNSKSTLFKLLNAVAGPQARHVVLGGRMASLLADLYGIQNSQITVLSNIAFFDADCCQSLVGSGAKRSLTIGHLANLCEAKGIADFVALCRELSARGVSFNAKLAGPFADSVAENVVRASCVEIDEVEYIGALYGEAKDTFFKSLDVFVFPSRYKNEAEPLVLYEAGQYGVLNIGTRRGCMEDVINKLRGFSIEEGPLMVTIMADTLQQQVDMGAFTSQARSERVKAFLGAQKIAKLVLDNVLIDMGADDVSKTK
jgi:glycosyltransferase involved in cell wall biosynthesis